MADAPNFSANHILAAGDAAQAVILQGHGQIDDAIEGAAGGIDRVTATAASCTESSPRLSPTVGCGHGGVAGEGLKIGQLAQFPATQPILRSSGPSDSRQRPLSCGRRSRGSAGKSDRARLPAACTQLKQTLLQAMTANGGRARCCWRRPTPGRHDFVGGGSS